MTECHDLNILMMRLLLQIIHMEKYDIFVNRSPFIGKVSKLDKVML